MAWKAGQHNEGQYDDTRGGGACQMSEALVSQVVGYGSGQQVARGAAKRTAQKISRRGHAHDARWSGAQQVALSARAAESERHSKADGERRQKIGVAREKHGARQ